jgi:hypothetical protein
LPKGKENSETSIFCPSDFDIRKFRLRYSDFDICPNGKKSDCDIRPKKGKKSEADFEICQKEKKSDFDICPKGNRLRYLPEGKEADFDICPKGKKNSENSDFDICPKGKKSEAYAGKTAGTSRDNKANSQSQDMSNSAEPPETRNPVIWQIRV